MSREWKIEGRHKWVAGAVITESHNESKSTSQGIYCRFTATIRGYRNWKLFEGFGCSQIYQEIQQKAINIRARIDSGDENIFNENTEVNL